MLGCFYQEFYVVICFMPLMKTSFYQHHATLNHDFRFSLDDVDLFHKAHCRDLAVQKKWMHVHIVRTMIRFGDFEEVRDHEILEERVPHSAFLFWVE